MPLATTALSGSAARSSEEVDKIASTGETMTSNVQMVAGASAELAAPIQEIARQVRAETGDCAADVLNAATDRNRQSEKLRRKVGSILKVAQKA